MEVRTHEAVAAELCGQVVDVREGFALVRLTTTPQMAADRHGLVHGGFVFGLADYAAMLAVNHPNVVLGRAETRFLKPVVVGDELEAEADLLKQDGRRRHVEVEVRRGGDLVFSGEFHCYTPDAHVLER